MTGIIRFTIGQRRGLGIATGEPLYVVAIDAASRRVVVGPREALATRAVRLSDVNWLGAPRAIAGGEERTLYVKIRSTQAPVPAKLCLEREGSASVSFDTPEYGVSAGQACVFYEDEAEMSRVLGGGWISSCTCAASRTDATGASGKAGPDRRAAAQPAAPVA